MDDVGQRVLARSACRLLPVLPHHPGVYCRRAGHGVVCALASRRRWSEGVRLGALVPEDARLRLHVHGLRPAEGQRHAALLELHLLHHPRRGARLHRRRTPDAREEEREEEGGERVMLGLAKK